MRADHFTNVPFVCYCTVNFNFSHATPVPRSHPVWFGTMQSFDSLLALVSPATGAVVLREGGRLRAVTKGRLYVGPTPGTSPAVVQEWMAAHCAGEEEWEAVPDEGPEGDCLAMLSGPTEDETDVWAHPPLRTVLDTMPCSVFVMHSDTCPDTVRRILLPVDVSDSAAQGVRYARGLASVYDAQVILLHVVDDNPYVALTRRDRLSMSRTALPEHRARRRLQKWMAGQFGDDQDVELLIRSGVPARQIRDVCAQQDIDLLMLPLTGEHASDEPPVDAWVAQVMRDRSGPVVLVRAGR